MPCDHTPTLGMRPCRPAPRPGPPAGRGLTLIEVLIAMFVLSVGLLGVAALLPLGQKKMLEAKIDQQKAIVADAGFNTLRNQGGLDPSRWVWPSATFGNNYFSAVKPATAANIICRVTGAGAAPVTSFTTDAAGLVPQNNYYRADVATSKPEYCVEFRRGKLRGVRRSVKTYVYSGTTATFTIDAANPLPGTPYTGDTLTGPDLAGNGQFVPGDTYVDNNGSGTYEPPDTFVVLRTRAFALDPLLAAKMADLGATPADYFAAGMPRLTLSQPGTASTPPILMNMPAAELTFQDDTELLWLPSPGGNSDPSQIYYNATSTGSGFSPSIPDANGSTAWEATLRRQSEGNFSWAATFVPSVSGNTELFNVSVAVFYKRSLPAVKSTAASDGVAMEVAFTGGGFGGGAALLKAAAASATPQADLAQVVPGKWLLISTNDNGDYRWYRVATVGTNFQDATNGGRWSAYVTLAGSDWNTTAAGTINVMFYPTIVGVFSRTIRIQSLPDSSN